MDKIKVGFQYYDVLVDDLGSKASDNYGLTNFEKGAIYIQDGLTPAQYMNTFIHEVLHACFHSAGFEKIFDGEKEEQVVNMFGNTIQALILDNPDILDYLTYLRDEMLSANEAKVEVVCEFEDDEGSM